MTVEFVPDLNPKRANREHWANVVQQLLKNPNTWGKVGNYSVGVADRIRNGHYVAFFPKGLTEGRREYVKQHWDVYATSTGEGMNDVFVMWKAPRCGCEMCDIDG